MPGTVCSVLQWGDSEITNYTESRRLVAILAAGMNLGPVGHVAVF